MKTTMRAVATAAGAAALSSLAFGIGRARSEFRARQIVNALCEPRSTRSFLPALLPDLPEPARRYLLHAIKPGTPLAHVVHLRMQGRMRPREGADLIDLLAEEVLHPARGFMWTAHFKIGPVPVQVRDHYWENDGAVEVKALSMLPLAHDAGPDATQSSRHRAAAEAVWLPAVLLPSSRARWHPVDDLHANVDLKIDDEIVRLQLKIDESGRLLEVTMSRYGNVGVPKWQPIPYGFAVEEEQTFGGYTIPSKIRGGWWYGTDRFDPDGATFFEVLNAEFEPRESGRRA